MSSTVGAVVERESDPTVLRRVWGGWINGELPMEQLCYGIGANNITGYKLVVWLTVLAARPVMPSFCLIAAASGSVGIANSLCRLKA